MAKYLLILSLLIATSSAQKTINSANSCERPVCKAHESYFQICETSDILISVDQIQDTDRLVINSDSIKKIAPNAFKNLTISNLTMIYTGEHPKSRQLHLTEKAFLGLPELKSLVIHDAEFHLAPNPLKHLGQTITYLRLINTGAVQIPPEFLADFPKLNKFFLMGHGIPNITVSTFQTINKKITKLSLRDGKIASVEPNSFAMMPDLVYVSLALNELTEVDATTFAGLDKLEEINLSGNKIKVITPQTVSSWPVSLGYLNLADNQLQVLDAGLFDKLTGMMYLYLNGNLFEHISKGVFNKLKMLKKLHLQHNRIESIDIEAFSGTVVDQELLIYDNNIRVMQTDTFKGLSARKLDLTFSGIVEIQAEAFKEVVVEQLILTDNQLYDVDEAAWGVKDDVDVQATMCYFS